MRGELSRRTAGMMRPPTASSLQTPAAGIANRRELIAHLVAIHVPDAVIMQLLARDGVTPATAERQIQRGHADLHFARRVLHAERRRVAWHHGIEAKLSRLTRPRGGIERVPYRSVKDVRRYYAANQPAIFTGMCARWNALGWTPQTFSRRFGREWIDVEVRRGHLTDIFLGEEVSHRRVQFAAFVEAVERGDADSGYLVSKNDLLKDPRFAELFDDLTPLPKILDPALLRRQTSLWLGRRGAVTQLHHYGHNNLFIQLHGRKRFRLVPRYALEQVYASAGVWSANRFCSPNDPGFPAARGMEVIDLVLEPGEALLIPVGWWHFVVALDVSIGLSLTGFYWPNDYGDSRDPIAWDEMPAAGAE